MTGKDFIIIVLLLLIIGMVAWYFISKYRAGESANGGVKGFLPKLFPRKKPKKAAGDDLHFPFDHSAPLQNNGVSATGGQFVPFDDSKPPQNNGAAADQTKKTQAENDIDTLSNLYEGSYFKQLDLRFVPSEDVIELPIQKLFFGSYLNPPEAWNPERDDSIYLLNYGPVDSVLPDCYKISSRYVEIDGEGCQKLYVSIDSEQKKKNTFLKDAQDRTIPLIQYGYEGQPSVAAAEVRLEHEMLLRIGGLWLQFFDVNYLD